MTPPILPLLRGDARELAFLLGASLDGVVAIGRDVVREVASVLAILFLGLAALCGVAGQVVA